MAKKSTVQRMREFKEECVNVSEPFITKAGYRAYNIDKNVFNKIFANYSDIAELSDNTEYHNETKQIISVSSRKTNKMCGFCIHFTDAKRGRPSKNQNTTETRNLWNGILEAAARAGK